MLKDYQNSLSMQQFQQNQVCRDIPEVENLNLSPEDQALLDSQLNLTQEQLIKLSFSKYELLQLIEHIEQKYQESQEQSRNYQLIIKQMEKSQQDVETNYGTIQIEQQKKFEQLQQELEKTVEQQKLDKLQFEDLNNAFYKISQENSQLLQYLQRQQSVIQEQEIQIQDYLQFATRCQPQSDKLNDNVVNESQLADVTSKLEELHQMTQIQRREILKLEIDKSLCEHKYKGAIQAQEIDKQKFKEELETLKSQVSQVNETSMRSKNVSSHTTSSKFILATELQSSQLNMKESTDENNQLKNVIKNLQAKIQEERECYQRNIEKFLIDLNEQRNKQESDQQFMKQLSMKKCQIKSKNEGQYKKLECQVELLKQIIDVCLKLN